MFLCSVRKFPDLFREFKDLLGVNEQGGGVEPVPHGATQKERISGELAMEIGRLLWFLLVSVITSDYIVSSCDILYHILTGNSHLIIDQNLFDQLADSDYGMIRSVINVQVL